jgi:hypothetical protein
MPILGAFLDEIDHILVAVDGFLCQTFHIDSFFDVFSYLERYACWLK